MKKKRMLIFGVGCCLALAVAYVASNLREWRAASLLREFGAAPTQQLADKLAGHIDGHTVSFGLGNEILREFVTPVVKARAGYPVGRLARVSVALRFPVNLPHMDVKSASRIDVAGGLQDNFFYRAKSAFSGEPQTVIIVVPSQTGTHGAVLNFSYELVPKRRKTKWVWPSPRSFPLNLIPASDDADVPAAYECSISAPLDLNVVPEGEAVAVRLLTDPGLDATMRAVVTAEPKTLPQAFRCSYETPSGRRQSSDALAVTWNNAPLEAVFRVSFRPDNGPERTLADSLWIRKGTLPTGRWLGASDFTIEQIGDVNGIVVFKPDPDAAFDDPKIDEIWGGTLEFPMTVHVEEVKKAEE